MKKIFKKLISCHDGSPLVELALILPIMLLLVVGSLDLGAAYVRKMELSNAAKAGIQYAMVRKPIQGDMTSIEGAVTAALGDNVVDSTTIGSELYCMCEAVKQSCTTTCVDPDVSAFVTITVTETFTTPFFNYDWFMSEFPIVEETTIQLN